MIRIPPGALFGCGDSPFFVSERTAKNENKIPEKQLFIDLPRVEPRKTEEAGDQAPPDLKDHDAIRDSGAASAEDSALNGILFLRPFSGGASLPYTAAVSGNILTVTTNTGVLECCFEDPETLRIRGTGTGLRFYAPLLDHEAAIDRQDGTYQVCIEASCEFLFVPLKGPAVMDNDWVLWHGGTRKLLLTVLPDEDGSFEMAVHMAPSSCERKTAYLPFGEVKALASARPPFIPAERIPKTAGRPESPLTAFSGNGNPETKRDPAPYAGDLLRCPLLPQTASDRIILSSTGRYDLRSAQFSRRGSFICIPENDEDRCLYLSVTRSPEMWASCLYLIRTVPVLGDTALPFEYDVEPGKMTIRTCSGTVEYCFDREGRLHVRGTGIGLRLEPGAPTFTGCRPGDHGSMEVSFSVAGRLLFVPVSGSLSFRSDACSLTFSPVTSGAFEAVVENGYDTVPLLPVYPAFDDCVRDAESDFDSFRKRFPALPEKAGEYALTAAWVIWCHTLGPSGKLAGPVVYMTRSQWIRAFSWQQSFHAMAAGNDIREAWKLLLNIFDYADRAGQLPDSISDIGGTWRVTKPALQGLAMLYLMDRYDCSCLAESDLEKLYAGLTRVTRWWLTFRDRNQSGLPQYFHADESPGEFCNVFRKGLPLYSADIASFVALTAEACGKLANLLGKKKEEAEWYAVSRGIIQKMTDLLWDGSRFQVRLVKTGEIVESGSVLAFLPVMLGDRLPKEIMDSMISRLMDETEYLSPRGITVENLKEEAEQDMPLGTVVYLNTLFSIALTFAGRTAEAKKIAVRALDLLAEKGFCFLDIRQDAEPISETADPLMPRIKFPAPAAKWTSWTCACLFILGDIVLRKV